MQYDGMMRVRRVRVTHEGESVRVWWGGGGWRGLCVLRGAALRAGEGFLELRKEYRKVVSR
jgi:hypothetical protein